MQVRIFDTDASQDVVETFGAVAFSAGPLRMRVLMVHTQQYPSMAGRKYKHGIYMRDTKKAIEAFEFYKTLTEASPPRELYWKQSREFYFAGKIIWSPFILDKIGAYVMLRRLPLMSIHRAMFLLIKPSSSLIFSVVLTQRVPRE